MQARLGQEKAIELSLAGLVAIFVFFFATFVLGCGAIAEGAASGTAMADFEVAVVATSSEVAVAAISRKITVGAGEVCEGALICDEFAVETALGNGDAIGDWAD